MMGSGGEMPFAFYGRATRNFLGLLVLMHFILFVDRVNLAAAAEVMHTLPNPPLPVTTLATSGIPKRRFNSAIAWIGSMRFSPEVMR